MLRGVGNREWGIGSVVYMGREVYIEAIFWPYNPNIGIAFTTHF